MHPANHTPIPRTLDRRSFLRRSAVVAAAAAASPALLSGCGSDAASGSGGSGEATFLSYLPLETLSMSPELLADAGGHFKKHGLDVKLQPVKGSPQAMQTLLSGAGPITRLGQIDLMTTVSETEQPMVNVGTLTRSSTIRFIYSRNDPLDTPEDFLGKTMGVPSEGGTSSKTVSLVLSNAGLDPEEVKRQVTGLTPGTFNLVQKGRIAGYVVSMDTANIVKSQSSDARIFNPGKYVGADKQIYVSTEQNIKDNADTLKAFMAGINDAIASVVADESLDDTLKALRSKYSFATLDDDKIAKTTLGQYRKIWTGGKPNAPLLVTDEKTWVSDYAELTKAGMASEDADPTTWFDNSMLPTS